MVHESLIEKIVGGLSLVIERMDLLPRCRLVLGLVLHGIKLKECPTSSSLIRNCIHVCPDFDR